MEFAKNVLIWAACFRHKSVFRFTFLRSDVFRHHMDSTQATYRSSNVSMPDTASSVLHSHDSLRKRSRGPVLPTQFALSCSPVPRPLRYQAAFPAVPSATQSARLRDIGRSALRGSVVCAGTGLLASRLSLIEPCRPCRFAGEQARGTPQIRGLI
jgi:hypothetical protein